MDYEEYGYGTRSRRKGKGKQKSTPSSALWLGYVEDGETPEMIMKKFEKLEQLQRSQQAPVAEVQTNNTEPSLTEDQLEKLFKETSYFSVNDVLEPERVYDIDEEGFVDEEFVFSEDEDDEFVGNAESSSFWDGEYEDAEERRKYRREAKKTGGGKGQSRTRLVAHEVPGEDGFVYTIKRKTKQIDPNVPVLIRIPPLPIPASWVKYVQPYKDEDSIKDPPNHIYIECKNILNYNLESLNSPKFQGILIDPPWKLPSSRQSDKTLIEPKDLLKLKLDKIMDCGILFVWVEKEIISPLIRTLALIGFNYVENLVWVKQTPNNDLLTEPYVHFNRSKSSLLLFRKGQGQLELRHQRNPDVIFDYVRETKNGGRTQVKPEFVYTTIETLLPTAIYEANKGYSLLELWANKGRKRENWISISQL